MLCRMVRWMLCYYDFIIYIRVRENDLIRYDGYYLYDMDSLHVIDDFPSYHEYRI